MNPPSLTKTAASALQGSGDGEGRVVGEEEELKGLALAKSGVKLEIEGRAAAIGTEAL